MDGAGGGAGEHGDQGGAAGATAGAGGGSSGGAENAGGTATTDAGASGNGGGAGTLASGGGASGGSGGNPGGVGGEGGQGEAIELTLEKAGDGSGIVASIGGGAASINCLADCSVQTASFTAGSVVSLLATPSEDSEFTGWSVEGCSGNPCEVTLNASTVVVASFSAKQPTLVVSTSGSGTGIVSGPGLECGGDCEESYAYGTVVQLTATPSSGATFGAWSDACAGTNPTCELTLTDDVHVGASFDLGEFSLSVSLDPPNPNGFDGSVESDAGAIDCPGQCSDSYLSGSDVTLTASDGSSWLFQSWVGGPCNGDTDPSCEVTLSASASITARFIRACPFTGSFSLASGFCQGGCIDPETGSGCDTLSMVSANGAMSVSQDTTMGGCRVQMSVPAGTGACTRSATVNGLPLTSTWVGQNWTMTYVSGSCAGSGCNCSPFPAQGTSWLTRWYGSASNVWWSEWQSPIDYCLNHPTGYDNGTYNWD